MNAHDSIMQGLNEALAFTQGQHVGSNIDRVEVPAVDVAAIRARTGLSQGAFARSIGVAKGTLLILGAWPVSPNWAGPGAASHD